jgi:predicted metalloprotease with PDZ domain
VHGTNPYEAILTESFDYLGLELKHVPAQNYSMGRLGFKTVPSAANFTVTALYPGGPADLAGMMIGDEILAVNAILCAGELEQWLSYFDNDVKKLTVIRSSRVVELILPEVMRNFYSEYSIIPIENPTKLQDNALAAWIS